MMEAAHALFANHGWQVRFDSTIPAGASTCHFTVWKATEDERVQWEEYSRLLEAKALVRRRA